MEEYRMTKFLKLGFKKAVLQLDCERIQEDTYLSLFSHTLLTIYVTISIPFPVCPSSRDNVLFHNPSISQLTTGLQNYVLLNHFLDKHDPNVVAQFVLLFHLHKVVCNSRSTHAYNITLLENLSFILIYQFLFSPSRLK